MLPPDKNLYWIRSQIRIISSKSQSEAEAKFSFLENRVKIKPDLKILLYSKLDGTQLLILAGAGAELQFSKLKLGWKSFGFDASSDPK